MKRTDGWDVRLVRWADARRGSPFEWGVTDCAMLAFEAIDAMAGGEELAQKYRGRWDSERAARRFQAKGKIDTAQVLIDAGCVEVPPGHHQRGDIIVVPLDGFQCAHVCVGRTSLSVRPGAPVAWVRTADLRGDGLRVFRIGG